MKLPHVRATSEKPLRVTRDFVGAHLSASQYMQYPFRHWAPGTEKSRLPRLPRAVLTEPGFDDGGILTAAPMDALNIPHHPEMSQALNDRNPTI